MTIEEIYKRIFSNFKILGLGKIFAGLCSALTIFILAQYLGVEIFGIIAITISIVEVLNIILNLRIWEATTKFLGDFQSDTDKCSQVLLWSLSLSIKFSLLSNFIICLISFYFIENFFNFDLEIQNLIISYCLFYIFQTSNEILDSFLRTYNKYKLILINNIISNLARLIIVYFLLNYSYNINFIIMAMGSSIFIGFFLRIFFTNKVFKELKFKFFYKYSAIKQYKIKFLKFSISTHFANMINLANEKNLGVLLVGYLVGPFYAGLFKAARSTVKIIRRIMDPLLDIAFPEFILLVNQKRLGDLKKLILNSTKILGLASISLGLLIFIFSHDIIKLFFGPEYIDATIALNLLIFAALINNISYWITPLILAMNNPKYLLVQTILVSSIYISTLYPLIINLEHEGAAYSGVLRAICVLIFGIIFIMKYAKAKAI
tara:strand:+ start:138785 stop:140083 length:1299 start_codon:yes stop_codon:yes gene_type:complete